MFTSLSRATLFVLLVSAAACGGNDKPSPSSAASDKDLDRDLALANGDSARPPVAMADTPLATVAPQSRPAPPGPAPIVRTLPRPQPRVEIPRPGVPADRASQRRPTPATTESGNTVSRTPRGSERPLAVIASGTRLAMSSRDRVCTNTSHVGDRLTATLSEPAFGSNGAVLPAGSVVTLEVTELKRSENSNDPVRIGLRALSVSSGGRTFPVEATTASATVDRVRNQPSNKDAQKVATGAAIGAIAGRILGGSTKSTVIGAAAGAAVGAGTASATANYEGCVPEGGRIVITLDSSLQIQS